MVITDLVGTAVVHKDKGVGTVTAIKDGMVSITMGLLNEVEASSVDVQRYSDRLVLGAMSDSDGRMTWKIPEESFLDRYEWSMAPSDLRMDGIRSNIRNGQSNIVIPTSNPPASDIVRMDMVDAHKRWLYANPLTYDDSLISVNYQITTIVDWQLSWFLLRGDESMIAYQTRLEDMRDDLMLKAWSDHILPEVFDETRDRVVECLAVVTAITATRSPEIPPMQHIQDINELIEARINVHSEVISGFLRGRRTQSQRRNTK